MTAPAAAIALVDFGSTFTKVRVVDRAGNMLATVQHRTTVESDVFDGLDGALGEVALRRPEIEIGAQIACSSAGGGLRLAVVGLVEDLTGEAARQAALNAGARVVAVVSGGLADAAAATELLEGAPDIVLLAGGTDGGDRASLLNSATALAAVRPSAPVVVAGNAEAQEQAAEALAGAGLHVFRAPNVLPEIGVLEPDGVRDVIREVFIEHVIGGKLSGSRARLEELVRMATPDAVLVGVELLTEMLHEQGRPGGVVVVDVGGATTDVHSSAALPPGETGGYRRSLLPQAESARTVEADLGMRWNAVGIIEAAAAEGLLPEAERARLSGPAAERAADPSFMPQDSGERAIDHTLAGLAIAVALRRHAGCRRVTLTSDGAVLDRDGRDLSAVPLLIGTGGIFQDVGEAELQQGLALARSGREQRLLPTSVQAGIDRGYVISAAGVLATEDEPAARQLLRTELPQFLERTEEDHVVATG